MPMAPPPQGQPPYGQPPYGQQPPYGAPPAVGYAPGPPPGPPQAMAPPAHSGCPPGLEYLTQLDQLLVKQQVEVLEILTGFETNNKYQVLNSLGQKVFFAVEDTDCCTRQMCGSLRAFDMKILDNAGREVVHLERPFRCKSCWYPCCLQEMTVCAPPGQVIGKIKQLCHPLRPKFAILDHMDNEVLYVSGPIFTCDFCGEIKFEVLATDGETEVGRVSKQWSGLLKEMVTDADNFGISFPLDMDVRIKATLMAIAFLIDFMYYEESSDDHHD